VGDGRQWGLHVEYAVEDSPRQTLERYTPGLPLSVDEVILDLLKAQTPPSSFEFDGYWLDIGGPDDYDRANAEFAVQRDVLLGDG
jgi:NDP-sugar pyrophosphorylase family protein